MASGPATPCPGFGHGGANRTPEEKEIPVVVEAGGVRIGMLCYTEMTNGMKKKKDNSPSRQYGVNYLGDADFDADVRKLRAAGAEVIIALPHWGVEYRREPTQSMELGLDGGRANLHCFSVVMFQSLKGYRLSNV